MSIWPVLLNYSSKYHISPTVWHIWALEYTSALCYIVFCWTEYCYRNVLMCFCQTPVRPVKTACDNTSLTDTGELTHTMSHISVVAETVEKFSALSDSFHPSSGSRSSNSSGISVQSIVTSFQSNLSQQNEFPVSVDSGSSAGKRDMVPMLPKPRQRSVSPVLSVVTTSSVSPTPPPLPTRPSSGSSDKSNSSVTSVTKRFRPPPPIPDETPAASPRKGSLSPHLPVTTSKSASPTVRRSDPVIG